VRENGIRFLGTASSGGEADVKKQYEAKVIAGASQRIVDGRGRKGVVLRYAALFALAIVATQTPVTSYADQQVTLVNPAHTSSVTVTVGKSLDVRTDQGFVDITVGDPDVADVNALTDHALSILGKKIGATRVTVYAKDKQVVGVFDVEVSYDVSLLNAEIMRFTGGGIRVSSINGRIMLSGTASDAATLDKAVTIARQFAPDVIDTVQVMQPQQVMLEVRFVEATRTASQELGVQWNVFGNHVLANIGDQQAASALPVATTTAAGVLSGSNPFGFLIGHLVGGSTPVDVALNALEQKGVIRNLAQPNLVALSGDTASFLAGGEYPIPVPGTLGQVTIEYKKYGVGLAFTPTVRNDGQINLVIKPNVSQLDPAHGVSIAGGINVPALTVREASTTIELRDGQSFMLGGLLQNQSQTDQDQMPWLGDVPVLGALFRSAEYQKNETDLVIIVTPRLVRPLRPVDPVHTPLDSTLPGNDIDFFLMGQAEVSPALARLAVGAINRPYVGHILDLPKNGGVYVTAKD
jgi:pilus assembly protein CpaC